MSNNTDNFPTGLEAIFLVIALFMAEYVFAAMLFDFNKILGLSRIELGVLARILGNGLIFTAVVTYKKLSYASLLHDSQFSLTATMALLSIPVLCLVPAILMINFSIQAVLVGASPLSNQDQQMFEQMLSPNLAATLATCLIAPIVEEMLFRGIILRSFLTQYRPNNAILASALLFGAAHLNIYQFFSGLLVGLVLGWLYQRTRSVWPGILLHAAYNSTIMFLSATTTGAEWQPELMHAVIALVLGSVGVFSLRKLLRNTAAID